MVGITGTLDLPAGNPGPGQTSNASSLGAVTFSSSDGSQALTIASQAGNEANGGLTGPLYLSTTADW